MAFANQTEGLREADELYDRYVRPLEETHRGEFVAVTPDGTMVLAPTLLEAVLKAEERPGTEKMIFKIGDLVVGSLR